MRKTINILQLTKKIIFSKIENLGNILEKIGEVFLCNVEINSTPTYLNLENVVCLNLNISEKNITAASLQATRQIPCKACSNPQTAPLGRIEFTLK